MSILPGHDILVGFTVKLYIITLNLKKKWFDMILSGEKKEEYREPKKYWMLRLMQPCQRITKVDGSWEDIRTDFENFDTITFKNGYQKNAPTFIIECKGIEIGKAKPEWSDNWQGDVFIIKLGKIL